MNNSATSREGSVLDPAAHDEDAHRDAELARLARAHTIANPRRTRR